MRSANFAETIFLSMPNKMSRAISNCPAPIAMFMISVFVMTYPSRLQTGRVAPVALCRKWPLVHRLGLGGWASLHIARGIPGRFSLRDSAKQIPPLRGLRSRSRAEEMASRYGRDDNGGGVGHRLCQSVSAGSRADGSQQRGNSLFARASMLRYYGTLGDAVSGEAL